jgi:hypothetical protein
MSLTNFMGIPNSIRMLYNTSLLTESQAFLKSMNSWCTVSLYSSFFSSICQMQKNWSVVDLLRRNPHWWSPIISSMYELNRERRIFYNILYEVDSSDIPRQLLLSVLSPVSWFGTIIDSFHWPGNSSLFQIEVELQGPSSKYPIYQKEHMCSHWHQQRSFYNIHVPHERQNFENTSFSLSLSHTNYFFP